MGPILFDIRQLVFNLVSLSTARCICCSPSEAAVPGNLTEIPTQLNC